MKSINPDPLTPDQAIDILHRAAAAEGAPIFKDCADVIVSLEKLRTQNEALTKEVERLKQLHITDMRVTNESADYHMKRCDSLRTQNRELRKATLREAAEIADSFISYPDKSSENNITCKKVRDAILTRIKEVEG